MHIELNPKLLDVVESPAEESELGTVGTLTGTVLEVFGQPPEAVLIEVTDEEGAHKGFVTRLIDQVRTVWRPLRREESEVLASQAPQLFEKGVLLLQNGLIASAKDHFGQAFKEEPQLVSTGGLT